MQIPSPICSLCKSDLRIITDPETGEIICRKCGMIISDNTQDITRPEWCATAAFDTLQINYRHSRTGNPTYLSRYDMGLYTTIGKTNKDGVGHKLDAFTYSTIKRLRTWDFRTQNHNATAINLMQAFSELDILKDKLALPDAIVEKTAYIYRKVQKRGLVRGRTITALLAASAYIACREIGIPRSLRDIASASNIKRKHLAKAYRLLLVELDFKVPLVDQMKCIAKVANIANLSEKTKRQAISIMNEVRKNDETLLSDGKNPMGFAATILYLSCLKTGENKTQIDISHAAGVTEVTLRNRFKDLKSKTELSTRRSDTTENFLP
jgi:transcription initiation factor TFIIB